MKITLTIDADTAVEFQEALNALLSPQVAFRLLEETTGLRAQETEPTPAPKPVLPQPIPPQPEPEPVKEPVPTTPEPEVPPVATAMPVEPKQRQGRPRKTAPAKAPVEPAAEAPNGKVADIIDIVATKPDAPVAVRQDLLDTFNAYVQTYGVSVGYSDVSKILQQTFGADTKKSSDIGDGDIGKAIAIVAKAIEENPFNRKRAQDAA